MQSQLGRTILKEMIQPQGRTVLHAGDIAHARITYLSACWRYCTHSQHLSACWRYCTRPQYLSVCWRYCTRPQHLSVCWRYYTRPQHLSVCWRYCTRLQHLSVCWRHTPAALVGMLKLLFAISSRQNMHAFLQSQLILASVSSGCRDLFRAGREFCRGLCKIEVNTRVGVWGGEWREAGWKHE